jgi:hypothetical protein
VPQINDSNTNTVLLRAKFGGFILPKLKKGQQNGSHDVTLKTSVSKYHEMGEEEVDHTED